MREFSSNGYEKRFSPEDLRSLERFTLSTVSQLEEQRLLALFRREVTAQYRRGLVICRFQPLHYGHIYLIKQALGIVDTIIIGIGSANLKDEDNPFSTWQREWLVRRALHRVNLMHGVEKFVHLNDHFRDDQWLDDLWLKETLKKTGEIDVVVGNNGWVNEIFEKAGIKTLEIPPLDRGNLQGKIIRKQLREEGFLC